MKAQEPLSWCRFYLLVGGWLVFNDGINSDHNTIRHRYLGAGPTSGECGFSLTNITEMDNGPVRSWIATETDKADGRFLAIIVARLPTAPALSLVYTGNKVTATCEVEGSRPVANMSWVLDEHVIRNNDIDDSPVSAQDEWRWPWMAGSIKQSLTLQLQAQHNGKDLKCVVSHLTLAQPMEVSRTISFKDELIPAILSLLITPLNLRLTEDLTTVDFTCTAVAPLSVCQFTWLEQRYLFPEEGPLVDLSQGHESLTNESYLDWDVKSYSYKGGGLEAGVCGVTMQVEGYKDWVFGCRVKGFVGGWAYNWTTLFATYSTILPITTPMPRERIVRAGQAVTMMCLATRAITGCHFNKPGTFARVMFDQDHKSLDSVRRHRYLGDGLEDGQCGIRLANITTYESGPVQCVVDASDAQGRMLLLLIVAMGDSKPKPTLQAPTQSTTPPSHPVLRVSYVESVLTASCTVKDSLPAANITWWLGDKIIRQDSVNDAHVGSDAPWQWPWETNHITQTITLKLKTSDQQQVILCAVSHETLSEEITAAKRIRIPG